jgi:ubiquinone/menaquinone biosynthesis C-methylase UbiE
MTDHTPAADSLVEDVRRHYAAAALAVTNNGLASCCESGLGASQYDIAELDRLPADAVQASLGCGNPTATADLREGDTVLDLGSGGGIDVLLSARRVGPTGHAYGLDMTDEMLDLARRNAVAAGATNVEFIKGHMEAIPLPEVSIDVVISNCVVNLSPNKPGVFGEIYRVLKPGGRIGISDLVADDHLTADDRARLGSYVDCIAGALAATEYRDQLTTAGFTEISLTRSHTVTDGLHATVIRATKPTI